MLVDGSPEHVVLKGLLTLARLQGSYEGGGVGVGQLTVLVAGGVAVLAWWDMMI